MLIQKDLSLANRLISALPANARGLLLEHSALVELKLHEVLIAAEQEAEHAYFPIDSFVSLIAQADDTPNVEVALVGNEGMFNTSTVLGVASSPLASLVQGAGRAFKIHRKALQLRRVEDACLRDVLYRYIDVRANQLARKAACMNYHTVEQRLARSLMMTRDRAHSSELFLTHESLALMLGARRESVSQAASAFQKYGLISYRRGYVMLLDITGLEAASCKCYQADLLAYRRAFSRDAFSAASIAPGRGAQVHACQTP